MRWLAVVVACAGCDALFRIDAIGTNGAMDAHDAPRADGIDAPDAPDAGPPTYCTTLQPPALFCADFDSPATSTFQTMQVVLNGSLGDVTVGTPMPTSGSSVLSAMVPISTSAEATIAIQNIGVAPFTGKIAFDVYPCAIRETVAFVTWPSPADVTIIITTTGISFSTSLSNSNCTLTGGVVSGHSMMFNHVVVSASPAGASVTVNGLSAGTITCTLVSLSTAPTLTIGTDVPSAATTCTTLFDTVVVN